MGSIILLLEIDSTQFCRFGYRMKADFVGVETIGSLAFGLIRGIKAGIRGAKANNSFRIRKGLGSGTAVGDDNLRKDGVVAIRMGAIEFDGRRMIVRDCRDDG